mgnify:FL=1
MELLPKSKLPHVETTIFTVMSALADKYQALNLSQGFPDFDPPDELLDRVSFYLNNSYNQYPPMSGVIPLRVSISDKIKSVYGAETDPEREITVTAGATEALYCAITSIVRPNDEVVMFDPCYDSYDPVVSLNGGIPKHLEMRSPDFRIDWDEVSDSISDKTRLIILNTPHNPTGTVLNSADIEALKQIVAGKNIYVISDEVYEHIIFDKVRHESICRCPELLERSFVISSFGKTFHATGWKIGYCRAPSELTKEFRKIHQFVNFTVSTPFQMALADYLAGHLEFCDQLGSFYQAKRDYFCSLLSKSRFHVRPSQGTYFQLLDYSNISGELDVTLSKEWTRELGIASIPISVFYRKQPASPQALLRFCFAKDDATLEKAGEILCRI